MALPFGGGALLGGVTRKIGQAFGLKPKPGPEPIADWNTKVQAMHKMAQKGTLNPQSPLVSPQMKGQPTNIPIKAPPVNPAVSSVRPSMATKPPAVPPPVTPAAPPPNAPYGGTPDANDPATQGTKAMLDQRAAAAVPPPPVPPPETPPPPAAAAPDFNAQLKAAQEAYLKTFEPSEDVTSTQSQLDAIAARQAMLQANEQAGEANVMDQPIAQTFVTGQQAALQRQLSALMGQEAAKAVPLSAKLAGYQAQREAAQKRAEAQLKFATPEKTDYETVSEGQSIIDPRTGKVVFQGTPKESADKHSPIYTEWQDAKGAGYTGTFNEYQTEDANRKRIAAGGSQDINRLLTPAELQLYGAPAGTTFGDVMGQVPEKPLSGEAAKVYSIATTIKPEIEQIKALLKGAGRLRITQILSGLDPSASRLIDQVADKVGRLRSGGAINQDEAKRFKEQILRAGDILTGDTTSAISALDALAAEADSVASNVRSTGNQPKEPGQGDDLDQMLDSLGFNKLGSDSENALRTLTIGKRDVRVATPIALRLARAAKDFKAATGRDLQINQDFRTHEEQARLYKELSKKGARVAPPGHSFHEKGLAIDVTNWKEAQPYLRKYGLVNDLPDDRGHFSYGETRKTS
jgi:hypothetical protein